MSSNDVGTTGWHPPTPEGPGAHDAAGGTGSTGSTDDTWDPQGAAAPLASHQGSQYSGWSAEQADQPGQAHGPEAPAGHAAPPAGYAEAARYMLATPRPGIIPLRPLGIGEILGGAFEALRASPKAMFLPSLVVMAAVGIVSAALTLLTSYSSSTLLLDLDTVETQPAEEEDTLTMLAVPFLQGVLVSLPPAVLTFLAAIILTGLLIVAVSYSVLGHKVTPGQAWARTRSRIRPLIGQSLLITAILTITTLAAVGIVTLLGYLLVTFLEGSGTAAVVVAVLVVIAAALACLALTVTLTVRLSLAPTALVLESTRVTESLRRSWTLTRGSTWRVLGILLLASLITYAIIGAIQTVAVVAIVIGGTLLSSTTFVLVLSFILSALENALILPFNAAVLALTYTDLRMRTEGLDVELRRSVGA